LAWNALRLRASQQFSQSHKRRLSHHEFAILRAQQLNLALDADAARANRL